jgi:UDP-N-acetylglucosamine 2-epimerase (non-hydrolysing)
VKILVCFGTRPEAIKMAPICKELATQYVDFRVCVTAQHREMLDQVLHFFNIQPYYDLDLMREDQSLNGISAGILVSIDKVLEDYQPDLVLVQGDTTTAMAISLSAFHQQVHVGHIEAGLRTYNKNSPYPEEINRQLISRLADFHFAPTEKAVQNLLKEGVKMENILKAGNTVVDALEETSKKVKFTTSEFIEEAFLTRLDQTKKLILVTGHRRENFGTGLKRICEAILELADEENFQIVYPVHLNPNVKTIVEALLENHPSIILTPPMAYPSFVWLMEKADLIISDSGGIQEEAPTFGKKVLITRDHTERNEGIEAGHSFLVGSDKALIISKTKEILNEKALKKGTNPYGDGRAAEKIVGFLKMQKF